MKRFLPRYLSLTAILLLPNHFLYAQTKAPKPQTLASTVAIYKPLLGFWKGELTYRDYTSDKQVSLPTLLEATVTPDAKSLRLHYTYDDGPRKQVEETDVVTIDPAKHSYRTQTVGKKTARIYSVSGLEPFAQKSGGTLVLSGSGEENGKKVAVRNTLTQTGQTLTMLHETCLPGADYRFRNRFRFTRSTKTSAITRLTARQLQADFVVFKKAYQSLHPGLYRYNTPEQMERHFDALQAQLNHDQSLADAYLAFAAFLAKIQCGHSYPNFFNQPASVAGELFDRPRVPFYFRWIDHKMIVTRSLLPDARLKPGTEVVSLNGVPVAKIRARLLILSRADGSNDAKRESNMEVLGNSQYEAFDVYYPLLFPLTGSQIKAQVKPSPSASPETLTLSLMTQAQRVTQQKRDADAEAKAFGDTPGWEFRFLADAPQTAYLRMPTWALYNSKWDWKAYLDNAFAQMAAKKTENLIIDLRGNEGGQSIGNTIAGKLIQKDLPLASFSRWVRYRKVPDDLAPYLDTWDPSFKDWGGDIRAPENESDGFFRMVRYDDTPGGDIIKAAAQAFTGRTFVIVGAENSSATFEFAQIVQQNHLATLVGQPTGGNQRGINGGAFFFLRLPNSKIEADIPLIGAFPPDVKPINNRRIESSRPDAGLTPDILVTPSIDDVRNGADTELNAIRRELQKGGR